MRRRRTRTGRRSLLALVLVALAAGCGGAGGESESAPPPAIEPAAAERLAATSDEIATLLDAGDVCGAAGLADELRAQVTEAINAGAVPARLQEDLSSKANELVNTVNCPPPPEEEPEDEVEEGEDGEDRGKGKGQDKKDDKKDGDDDGILPPIELPPDDPEDG